MKKDPEVEAARKAGIVPITDEDWAKYIEGDDIHWNQVVVVDDDEQAIIAGAKEDVLHGMLDTTSGLMRIVRGLLTLKAGDLWMKDPLVAHLERPRWKEDYLKELAESLKHQNPSLQASLSTLQNYIRYHHIFVEYLGIEPELVFGGTENTRRAVVKMAKWPYGSQGTPELRNGYDIDKLPAPSWAETREQKIKEGLKAVAVQALSLSTYQPDLFQSYERGDGKERTTVSMKLELDERNMVCGWTAFVKKVDGDGDPLSSVAYNLFLDEMPGEVFDWLEEKGWTVECTS